LSCHCTRRKKKANIIVGDIEAIFPRPCEEEQAFVTQKALLGRKG